MKTILILVGKTTDKHFQAGISDYADRITHYMPFDIVTFGRTTEDDGGRTDPETVAAIRHIGITR